ncbi:MAG: hypothetical protein L3J68_00170 [Thermoplasmata archaeon]|nr:hypothetical protein [Thermoplasmata archaeon]
MGDTTIHWSEAVRLAERWWDEAADIRRLTSNDEEYAFLRVLSDDGLRAACLGAAIAHFEQTPGSLFDTRRKWMKE